ncbi:stromelysin-2-like [Episyrphus balteatus]|uniref:stromelysin-2-like n=1 Tax=Episyrphus balteatus TaxID=286459 RepID=UPI00248584D5|nr:stromelysin-2-like [Episyrphus balteatus]
MSCRNVFIILTTLLLSTVVLIHSAPVQSSSQAQMYLSKFGYLPETSSGNLQMIHENTMIQAIQNFQEFAGLDVTGQLDSKTLELMSLPRCGVKDKRANSRSERSFGTAWRKKDLTYRISRYTRRMDRNNVDAEIARAFSVWSEHTDLSFTAKRNGPVDIDITFLEGEHGDGNPFDGTGGTLAHAYSPEYGDAHFDDAEHWSINSPRGTNLFQVAAHEFGHSLGLDHSSVQEALMAPYYRRYEPYFRLHSSDITEIQELYGRKSIQEDSNNGRSEEPTSHHHHHNDDEGKSF